MWSRQRRQQLLGLRLQPMQIDTANRALDVIHPPWVVGNWLIIVRIENSGRRRYYYFCCWQFSASDFSALRRWSLLWR
ncbi:hypothetical protein [Idiomarina tyrosinivorans]|uniref:hypothetical protein n=1 Tax=Idiomarina tyrosinivorans TaxID=1445662 RepID=UPI000F887B34|nr:hypothetical protein [Idiomarina tyrosinivorans]